MMEQFNSMKYDVQGIYLIDKTNSSFSFMVRSFTVLFMGKYTRPRPFYQQQVMYILEPYLKIITPIG